MNQRYNVNHGHKHEPLNVFKMACASNVNPLIYAKVQKGRVRNVSNDLSYTLSLCHIIRRVVKLMILIRIRCQEGIRLSPQPVTLKEMLCTKPIVIHISADEILIVI